MKAIVLRRHIGSIALRAAISAAALSAMTSLTTTSWAQESEAQREANVHFHRAVQLYGEADYRAALVEFKRAYELAPHVTVLYNIGQTHYQLQNYAEALTAFERFLAEGGTGHKSEVENAISVLRTRVGKVDVTTPSPGWEISVDDEVVGKTPLSRPVAVSIGRRKVTASKAGEQPQTKLVEVAAGETMGVRFSGGGSTPNDTATTPSPGSSGSEPQKQEGTSTLLIAGWAGTGALAVGAVVTGILASSAASDLDDMRNAVPGNKSELDDQASKTTTLSVLTDVLAGSAIVLGGISLYFTLKRPSASAAAPGSSTVRLGVGGAGRVTLSASF